MIEEYRVKDTQKFDSWSEFHLFSYFYFPTYIFRKLLQRNPALRMCEPRIKRHPYFSMMYVTTYP